MNQSKLTCEHKEKLIMCILSDDYTIMEDFKYFKFNYMGYDCLIKENPEVGFALGYIRLENKYAEEQLYEFVDFEITLIGKVMSEEGFWVGFDCGHSYDEEDSIPYDIVIQNMTMGMKPKTFKYNFGKAFRYIKSSVETLSEEGIR